MIKVLIVDDQVLFAETLQTVITMKAEDIEIVGRVYNGKEAVEASLVLDPDIILMDVRMPVMDGVKAACEIHRIRPEIKIMMLTTFDDDAYVHDALEGGAVGYLLKNMPSDELINSIRAVKNGTLQISPTVASQLMGIQSGSSSDGSESVSGPDYSIEELSRREREILYLMSRGYDNGHIAAKLFLAEQTVKNHISRIYHKLQLHDRMAVMKAARHSELSEYCRYLLDEE